MAKPKPVESVVWDGDIWDDCDEEAETALPAPVAAPKLEALPAVNSSVAPPRMVESIAKLEPTAEPPLESSPIGHQQNSGTHSAEGSKRFAFGCLRFAPTLDFARDDNEKAPQAALLDAPQVALEDAIDGALTEGLLSLAKSPVQSPEPKSASAANPSPVLTPPSAVAPPAKSYAFGSLPSFKPSSSQRKQGQLLSSIFTPEKTESDPLPEAPVPEPVPPPAAPKPKLLHAKLGPAFAPRPESDESGK